VVGSSRAPSISLDCAIRGQSPVMAVKDEHIANSALAYDYKYIKGRTFPIIGEEAGSLPQEGQKSSGLTLRESDAV
jgi:hypothetical protein